MRANLKTALVIALLLLLLTAGTTALAQSSASFKLSRHVISGGGGVSTSASYRLHGTVGQSITRQPTASSASFRVSSGFWTAEPGPFGYLPSILNK